MTTEVAKQPVEEKPTANVNAEKAENAKVLKTSRELGNNVLDPKTKRGQCEYTFL